MELVFETVELKEICEHRQVAIDKLGEATALELAQKLADLAVVENVAELELLYPHAMGQDGNQARFIEFAVGVG